jgi:hypothetical protein
MPDFPIQQKVAESKRMLESDPTNVEVANRYWSALGSVAGNDVRSGGFVIEAFRGCALTSKEGAIAFCRAYQELYAKTGESPRANLFDDKLLTSLRTRLLELSMDERGQVEWVLSFVE